MTSCLRFLPLKRKNPAVKSGRSKFLRFLVLLLLPLMICSLTVKDALSMEELAAFDNTKYLAECGGRIYANCDDELGLSQISIFREATELARSTNRLLIVDFGGDWCSWCLTLDKVMKNDHAEMQRLNELAVVVPINMTMTTAIKLRKVMEWEVLWAPTFIVVNFVDNGTIHKFSPASFNVFRKLVNFIEDLKLKRKVDYASWYPASEVGSKFSKYRVSLNLLHRKIELNPKVISLVSDAQVTTKSSVAKSFYKQGFFHLFTYNYVDAVRSFKAAVDHDTEFAAAYAGLAASLIEIGDRQNGVGAALKALRAAKRLPLKKSESDFINLVAFSFCQDTRACQELGFEPPKVFNQALTDLQRKLFKTAAFDVNADFIVFTQKELKLPDILLGVLAKYPSHIGANHLLVHYYEDQENYQQALIYSEKIAFDAPESAHAQHMYGHVLPKLGKFKEATLQFEKANLIHEKWMKENQANEEDDWHFRHNLDLLAHTYNWNRQFKSAEANWKKLCETFGNSYCVSYTLFLLSQKQIKAAQVVLESADFSITPDFDDIEMWVDAFAHGSDLRKKLTVKMVRETTSPLIRILGFVLEPTEGNRNEIEQLIMKSISQAGFDSWSKKVLEAEAAATLAEVLGHKDLAAQIRIVKSSVGFICRAKTK